VLRRGVVRGDFLRGRSVAEIMSRVVEFSSHDARPLVKVYSRKEARDLFGLFKSVTIEVEQLTRAELRFLSPLVSESMLDRLRKLVGWNVIVTAVK
jgi:predicted nucleotidyltransferase component of viral defense system